MSTEPSKDHDCQPNPELPQWAQDLYERLANPLQYQPWSPPEDPDKPGLPYLPGFTAGIHRHCTAGTESRPHLSEERLKSMTQSELVATCPATEPSTPAPSDTETAQININAPISIGAVRGPQIVACTVALSRTSKHFQAAAKIYDPLYYNFKTDIGNYPRDCVYEADEDYRTEAAAYEHLRKHPGQSSAFAPEYYDSWAFALSITVDGKPQTRTIRLILMELLDGTSIQATRIQNNPVKSMGTDSFHYPEEYRIEVLARAIDGYVRQLRTGLVQGDFAGRNVMLIPKSHGDPRGERVCGLAMPRIVLIDYNIARIGNLSLEPGELPANPAEALWGEDLWHDFPGWVPNEWQDVKVQQDWLLRRFYSDDSRHLYRPFSEYFSEQKVNGRLD